LFSIRTNKKYVIFKDIFPGLSTTKVLFQDFPGPGIFNKKIQDFPVFQEAWEPWSYGIDTDSPNHKVLVY